MVSKVTREDWDGIRSQFGTGSGVVPSAEGVQGMQKQVIERLGTAIAVGELLPSEQIVPEELAVRHGVSRTVIRECLKVLETKGMVLARQRVGTRIRPREEWNLLDPDVIRWRSSGPDSSRQIEELLAIRGAIEPLAARQASSMATEEQIAVLEQALSAMQVAVAAQDWDAFTEADVAFHRDLLASSGNLIIRQFAEPIEAAIRVRHRLHLVPDRLTEEIIASHRAIATAIAEHDEVVAEHASRSIVDVAGAETMKSLLRDAAGSGEAGRQRA